MRLPHLQGSDYQQEHLKTAGPERLRQIAIRRRNELGNGLPTEGDSEKGGRAKYGPPAEGSGHGRGVGDLRLCCAALPYRGKAVANIKWVSITNKNRRHIRLTTSINNCFVLARLVGSCCS